MPLYFSPLEKTVVQNFRNEIKRLGGRTIKTRGSDLMAASLEPDIIGCLRGYLFAAEAKRDKTKKATRGQEYCLEEWKQAGAITLVFWDWKKAVEYILEEIKLKETNSGTKFNESDRVHEGYIPY